MTRYYKSGWKVTYDPGGVAMVLLDFGDTTPDELALPWKQNVDRHRIVGASWAGFHARGNIEREFRVTRVDEFSAPDTLREAVLSTDAALSARAGEVKGLEIAVEGGDTYETAKAAFISHEPRLMEEGRRVAFAYTLAIAGLTLKTP